MIVPEPNRVPRIAGTAQTGVEEGVIEENNVSEVGDRVIDKSEVRDDVRVIGTDLVGVLETKAVFEGD